MTAINSVLNALRSGERLTPRQISSRYNVKNPWDVIYRLRNESYEIITFERKNSEGHPTRFYDMPDHDMKVIAA